MTISGLGGQSATVSLKKQETISLKKLAPSLKSVHCGLQWDVPDTTYSNGKSYPYDLDLIVFSLDNKGITRSLNDILYYDVNLRANGLEKSGDNRTGEGDGDDEWVNIEFDKLDSEIQKIVIVVSIYDAQLREQTFGQVSSAMFHIDNLETDSPIAEFKLTDNYSVATSVVIGEFTRLGNSWSFTSLGDGERNDLSHYFNKYAPYVTIE